MKSSRKIFHDDELSVWADVPLLVWKPRKERNDEIGTVQRSEKMERYLFLQIGQKKANSDKGSDKFTLMT